MIGTLSKATSFPLTSHRKSWYESHGFPPAWIPGSRDTAVAVLRFGVATLWPQVSNRQLRE